MSQTVHIDFIRAEDIQKAAQFLAGLAREGVTFDCRHENDKLVVTFTGGF